MEDFGSFKLPIPEVTPQTAGERLANVALDAQVAGQAALDSAMKFQVGGYSLSGLQNKAMEGAKALASSFGIKLPDAAGKIGALGGAFSAAGMPAAAKMGSAAIGTSDMTAGGAKAAIDNPTVDKEYFVTLRDSEGYIIEFIVMPTVIENRNAQYEPVAPPQFPGAFQKYKGTDSVTWNLSCMFISRTSEEASINLRNIFRLRSWVMPYFGVKTGLNPLFKDKLGAPPPVLRLKGLRGLVGEVPVVITSLNWTWPRDVDYIPAWDPSELNASDEKKTNPQELTRPTVDPMTPFPAVIEVAINLTESYSTEQINNFDLGMYRIGKLREAFAASQKSASAEQSGPIAPGDTAQEAQTVPEGLHAPSQFLTDNSGPSLSGVLPGNDPNFASSLLTKGTSFMEKAAVSELNKNLLPIFPRHGGTRAEVNAAGVYVAKGD